MILDHRVEFVVIDGFQQVGIETGLGASIPDSLITVPGNCDHEGPTGRDSSSDFPAYVVTVHMREAEIQ